MTTSARKALIHVGTHKTGTKSIQLFLSRNWTALRNAGLYVPNAGRHFFSETAATPGHHDLAAELATGERALLDALLVEIERAAAPTVFLSSEEFHPLAFSAQALPALRDALAGAGYEPVVIVYLRAQAEYAQSLYAELAKTQNSYRFTAYLQSILATGRFGSGDAYVIEFEYSRLLAALADCFGSSSIVARPYDARREPAALVTDMMRVLATLHGSIPSGALSDPSLTINTRSSFRALLEGIGETAQRTLPQSYSFEALAARLHIDLGDPRFDVPFAPMSRQETLTVIRRFAEDNARVEAMASIVLPGTSEADVLPAEDPRWSHAAWQRELLDLMTDVWFR